MLFRFLYPKNGKRYRRNSVLSTHLDRNYVKKEGNTRESDEKLKIKWT